MTESGQVPGTELVFSKEKPRYKMYVTGLGHKHKISDPHFSPCV